MVALRMEGQPGRSRRRRSSSFGWYGLRRVPADRRSTATCEARLANLPRIVSGCSYWSITALWVWRFGLLCSVWAQHWFISSRQRIWR